MSQVSVGEVSAALQIGNGIGGIPQGLFNTGDLLGSSSAPLGDINMDGVQDMAIGAAHRN